MKEGSEFIHLDFGGESLHLHPEKAVFFNSKSALLIADTHFGKATHFRKSGIPVSDEVFLQDLNRLNQVVEKTSAKLVYVLGDLFHSKHNSEWERLGEWLKQSPIEKMILIPGNHDKGILKLEKLHKLDIAEPEIMLGNILLSHHGVEGEQVQIHGHVHPCVHLKGKAKQGLKLPCFHQRNKILILPAFGGFTGSHVIKPQKGDCYYPVAGSVIYESMV